MKKNKIGTIFLVSVLVLTGIGITYAGLTDTINVYGTVETGTVDLKIDSYSGTWVWKVYDATDEIVVTSDPDFSVPIEDGFLVSYAKGRPTTTGDPEGYDAVIEFDNLFPCVDFMADIVFHYEGSIPAKVIDIDWGWEGDEIILPDDTSVDFITWLLDNGHMTAGLYRCDEYGKFFDPLEPVDVGYQLHNCNYFRLIVTIHLPQENFLQGLTGNGYFKIDVLQWSDPCDDEPEDFDIEITKVASTLEPNYGEEFTYTITAKNLGPGDATGVTVQDTLPNEVTYVSDTPSKGTYNDATGIWNVGALAADETATLDITVLLSDGSQTEIEFTQLALILDGSGSISGSDWEIMLDGIALAITDGNIPHNGRVELTVIQFGGWENQLSWAQLELLSLGGPVVLTPDNYLDVANAIEEIDQLGGGTAMSCAFRLAADVLSGDANGYLADSDFAGYASTNSDWKRQVVNLITDGNPNVIFDEDNMYYGSWADDGGSNEFVLGRADTEAALTYFLNTVGMNEDDGDEIDVEAVGDLLGPDDIEWLKDNICWPQPGYDDWPPTGPGWVKEVDTYTELANTLKEKFQLIFESIENCATLITPDDINPDNNQDCVIVIPQLVD